MSQRIPEEIPEEVVEPQANQDLKPEELEVLNQENPHEYGEEYGEDEEIGEPEENPENGEERPEGDDLDVDQLDNSQQKKRRRFHAIIPKKEPAPVVQ